MRRETVELAGEVERVVANSDLPCATPAHNERRLLHKAKSSFHTLFRLIHSRDRSTPDSNLVPVCHSYLVSVSDIRI